MFRLVTKTGIFLTYIMSEFISGVKEIINFIVEKCGMSLWFLIFSFLVFCYIIMRRYEHLEGKSYLFANKQRNIINIIIDGIINISKAVFLFRAINFWVPSEKVYDSVSALVKSVSSQSIYDFLVNLYDLSNAIFPFSTKQSTNLESGAFSALIFIVFYELYTKEVIREFIKEKLIKICPTISNIIINISRIIRNFINRTIGRIINRISSLTNDIRDHRINGENEQITSRFFGSLYEYDPIMHRYFLKEGYKWYRFLWLIIIIAIIYMGFKGVFLCNGGKINYNLVVFPLYMAAEFW